LDNKLPVAAELHIFRNDHIPMEKINNLQPDGIVIPPGPSRPENASLSLEII